MRPALAAAAVLVLAACPEQNASNPPPLARLYFPTGVVHADVPGTADGVLFVASANTDQRFESGMVSAIDLDKVGLPKFGAAVGAGGPVQLTDLHTTAQSVVEVSSFTGEMAALATHDGGVRLYVPSRSEGMHFQAVDATLPATAAGSTSLQCHTAAGKSDRDCGTKAPSLTPREFEFSSTGLPRAPAPFSVAVRQRGCAADTDCGDSGRCGQGLCRYADDGEPLADVWVTHLAIADSPTGTFNSAGATTQTNFHTYLVHLASRSPTVDASNFLDMGAAAGATSCVAAGSRWVYATGRYQVSATAGDLLRLIDPSGATILSSGIESVWQVLEGRGLALSSDESRVFIAGRSPDSLVVASVAGASGGSPSVRLEKAVMVPAGPNAVTVLPRPGHADLVAVASTSAGTVVLYDDDVGSIVAQLSGVGLQPFNIAADLQGAGARLYVTAFGDGRVAVIDIPDLQRPQEARLVAHLGEQQLCLTATLGGAVTCDGGVK